MAFVNSDLVLLAHGNDKKLFYYSSTSDSLATIYAAGYFNNTDDDIRMSAGDMLSVKGSDGVATLEVTAVSSGSVSTREIGGGNSVINTGSTTTTLAETGIVKLTGTTIGTHNLTSSPAAGGRVTILNAGVAAHVITTTGTLMIGSTGADTVTLGGIGSGIELLAASTTQYLIVGSVQPSVSTTDTAASYALS